MTGIAGADQPVQVVQGAEPGDDGAQVVVGGGVGGVEGPVAAALVLVVVGEAGRVADLRVVVVRVDPGQVLGGGAAAPVLDDHLRGGGAAPRLAAVVVLRVLADVGVLRVARHGQFADAAGAGRGDGEAVGDVGGHRPGPPDDGRGAAARGAVERQAQAVRDDPGAGGGVVHRDGVGPDAGAVVALVVDGGTPDVLVARGPAAEHVPGGAGAVRVDALRLDLEPGPGRGAGVPGGDQLGGGDLAAVQRGGPGGVLPGGGRAGVRVGVLGDTGRRGDTDAGAGTGDDADAGGAALEPVRGGAPEPVVDGGGLLPPGGRGRGSAPEAAAG